MIFVSASTSAYDENEVYLAIKTEPGESVKLGDVISIPMNDHTYEQRAITGMLRDWKKRKKGKETFTEIRDGEWAECIIHNIHSERIHTISSPYDDDPTDGAVMASNGEWHDDETKFNGFFDIDADTVFPKLCPICHTESGHIFYYQHGERHAGVWVWCSHCKAYSHGSYISPEWWKNPPFIRLDKLCHEPDYLEENAADVDKWINELLRSREESL